MQPAMESEYRPVSTTAIVALALGVGSLAGLVFVSALALSVAGAVAAAVAWYRIGRAKGELHGRRLCKLGAFLCLTSLLAGAGLHTYWYVIEAPPGYLRLDFRRDLAEKRTRDLHGLLVIDPQLRKLDGKPVCLKGYAVTTARFDGMTEFLLTPDGALPGGFDAPMLATRAVLVVLRNGESWQFNDRYLAVSGEFQIADPADRDDHRDVPLYSLKNATVRPATSEFGFRNRKSGC